jgi:hypothetical protein
MSDKKYNFDMWIKKQANNSRTKRYNKVYISHALTKLNLIRAENWPQPVKPIPPISLTDSKCKIYSNVQFYTLIT